MTAIFVICTCTQTHKCIHICSIHVYSCVKLETSQLSIKECINAGIVMIWAITTSIKLDSCGNKWKMNEIISIEIPQKQNIEYKRNRTQTKWQHFYNDHTQTKTKEHIV